MERNGAFARTGPFETHYHDLGAGPPVVLLHGSGPGVSAWENWSGVAERLAKGRRIVAPDMAGFGFTKYGADDALDIKAWSRQLLDFLDGLGLERVVLVGNSFGGGLSLATALRNAPRVAGLVLMGTPTGEFEQSEALAAGTEYEPSPAAMRAMLARFPYDPAMITDEMVATRHQTSLLHPDSRAFKALMPPPGAASGPRIVRGAPLAQIATLELPTLVIHGREDGVIPAEVGVRTAQTMPNADLVMLSRCGHWVQLERPDDFVAGVERFLDGMGWGS